MLNRIKAQSFPAAIALALLFIFALFTTHGPFGKEALAEQSIQAGQTEQTPTTPESAEKATITPGNIPAQQPDSQAGSATNNGTASVERVHYSTDAQSATSTSAFSWSGYFWALGMLFFIIAFLWIGAHFLKRRGGLKLFGIPDVAQVEGRIALGQNRYLLVVTFAGKRLLLGVTEHNINLLTEQASAPASSQPAHPKKAAPQSAAFQAILEQNNGN